MGAPFDVCIIGAGPAGYAAAMRAHDLGRTVLLIERGPVGGAGIHHGALSSKTLWELAKDYATACRTDRGYRAHQIDLAYTEVTAAVRAAVAERQAVLECQLTALADHITLMRGTATFVGPRQLVVDTAEGRQAVNANHYLIATGSRPRGLPDFPADGERVLTSDHIEALPDFPERLVIVGAGVVGCEYATIFARFGRTGVHLLDRESRILPFEDPDVSEVVSHSFRQLGVTIHHQTRLKQLVRERDSVKCLLSGPKGDTELEASHVLLSIGRIPNTDHIGLDAAGLPRNPRGTIVVDQTQTPDPAIHAAGDTTADVAVANVAELEGRHAIEHMFGLDPRPLSYGALPSILFLAPEVASVGLNEQMCKERGIPYRVAVLQNALVPRNVAMRSTAGFVKLLAHPDGRILGLRVVGPQASSAMQGVALLIDRQGTLEDLDRCFHPHPAVPEGVQECARLLLGHSIHKPALHGGAVRVDEG